MVDFAAARREMVQSQLVLRGIKSPRVLEAMGRVPREKFVPEHLQDEAYADRALPIDCEQTVSQPYIVGLMTEALALTGAERVLEIGTGSGYQAAVLSELAQSVISLERHAALSLQAGAALHALGHRNVKLHVCDGNQGWPDGAPYDRIIVTAAAAEIPPALFEQLREGGIMVIPLGASHSQILYAIHKINGRPRATELSGCRFVPFVGAAEED